MAASIWLDDLTKAAKVRDLFHAITRLHLLVRGRDEGQGHEV
jgi:hypothetical protein